MSNIVIDTNILYSWVGISEDPRLPSSTVDRLSRYHQLWATTATIIELIVKYRRDLDSIKRCLQPLMDGRVELVNIGFVPVTFDAIRRIYQAETLDSISSEIDDIYSLKIQKESEFLRFIFIVIIFGYFYVSKQNGKYTFTDETKIKNYDAYLSALLLGNKEHLLNTIKDDLVQGYQSNDEQRAVKKSFASLFSAMISAGIMNYYLVKNSFDMVKDKFPDRESEEAYKKEVACDYLIKDFSKPSNPEVTAISDNPTKIIRQEAALRNQYFNDLKTALRSLPEVSNEVLDYILIKMDKFFTTNTKIAKNDMIDLLQIYSLSLSGYTILTLDGRFNKALKETNSASFALAKSLGIVN